MIAVIVFGLLVGALLVLLLARWGTNPAVVEARRRTAPGVERIGSTRLRLLVVELLTAMGVRVEQEAVVDDDRRLSALRPDPFQPSRYVVFVDAAPPGDVVDAARVLELAEAVKSDRAAAGLLFTPYAIDAAALPGLDVPLELIDGVRMRELVAEHLPARLRELEGYLGFPSRPVPPVAPLSPRPA